VSVEDVVTRNTATHAISVICPVGVNTQDSCTPAAEFLVATTRLAFRSPSWDALGSRVNPFGVDRDQYEPLPQSPTTATASWFA
jgi:hypothetical protein